MLDAHAWVWWVQGDPRLITVAVAAEVAALPDHFHRDPADRVIVASSRLWSLPLLSSDAAIKAARLTEMWKAPSR